MENNVKKILLLEDSDTDAFLIKRVIRDYPCAKSYSILNLTNMHEAKQFIASEGDDVALVLLDLHLPDTVDEVDTYSQLRAILPQVPIIALTSSQDHDLAMLLLNKGIEDFVCKSHILDHPDLLCRAIDFAMCRHQQSQSELRRLTKELDAKTQLLSQMM